MGRNPIQVFLGVDGGGSNTRTLLVNQNGEPISKGLASGSNPHNLGYAKAASNIAEAVQAALASSTLDRPHIASAFCGIAGIRNTEEQSLLADELKRFSWAQETRLAIDHDVSIAFAAVLGNSPGITLICGTGSSCLGKDTDRNVILTSGRTDTLDDPGSGYAIGIEAIKAGLLSSSSQNRNTIAKLAPQLIDLATEGNLQAQNILHQNANALVDLVRETLSQISLSYSFNLGIIGSLGTTKTTYQKLLLNKIASNFPDAKIRFTNKTPVEAAAQLALS